MWASRKWHSAQDLVNDGLHDVWEFVCHSRDFANASRKHVISPKAICHSGAGKSRREKTIAPAT